MQFDDNSPFVLAHDLAAQHGLETQQVIELIIEGELAGRFFNSQWFVDTSASPDGYADLPQIEARFREQRQSDPVKPSSNSTESAAAASASGEPPSADSKSPSNTIDVIEAAIPLAQALRIVGIITIGFGFISGLVLCIKFSQPVASITIFGSTVGTKGELTLTEAAISLGIVFSYAVPGVLCLGVSRVIEVLQQIVAKKEREN